MKNYYVDDDGYIVDTATGDTVAYISDQDYVQDISQILNSNNKPTDQAGVNAAPDLLTAMEAMFEHCVMIHKHWGKGCNQEQADAAVKAGHNAVAKARQ